LLVLSLFVYSEDGEAQGLSSQAHPALHTKRDHRTAKSLSEIPNASNPNNMRVAIVRRNKKKEDDDSEDDDDPFFSGVLSRYAVSSRDGANLASNRPEFM